MHPCVYISRVHYTNMSVKFLFTSITLQHTCTKYSWPLKIPRKMSLELKHMHGYLMYLTVFNEVHGRRSDELHLISYEPIRSSLPTNFRNLILPTRYMVVNIPAAYMYRNNYTKRVQYMLVHSFS